jgi:hypothetical protein
MTLKVFQKPPVILKLYTGENQLMTAKERRNRNSDAADRTIFRISNCVQRNKQKLYNYFSLPQGDLRRYGKY